MVEDQTEKTIQTYNAIACDYERKSFDLDAALDLPRFTELLPRGSRVLDAGCGYGRELRYFIDKGFETYGIDLSEPMLALAKKRAPETKISKKDVRKTDFSDNFFDAVWCRGVLHHLPRNQIPEVLTELERILKPNGVLFAHCRKGEGEAVLRDDLSSGQERFFTQVSEEELRQMVENAGFNVLSSYVYNEKDRYEKGREDAEFVVVLGRRNG